MTRTKYTDAEIWQRRGFLPFEVNALQELHSTTMAVGRQAPYIRAMVRHRLAIVANARRYEWSAEKYTDYIIAEYSRKGIGIDNKNSYYDYLKVWKDKWFDNKGISDDPYWKTPRAKQVIKDYHAQMSKREMIENKLSYARDGLYDAQKSGKPTLARKFQREINKYNRDLSNL